MRPHIVEAVLTNQDRRGFEVNPLVLDAHHDHPPRVLPIDRQGQRRIADDRVDRGAHPVAIGLDLGDGRPVVIRLVEVVPTHFIDPDGEHRLEPRIDPFLEQPDQQQLVDEEGRGVAEIENQRVTQCDRLFEIRFVAGQYLEQLLVAIECPVKIVENAGTASRQVGIGEWWSSGKKRC